MTDWTRSERIIKVVEYIVPAPHPEGANYVQVIQAIDKAKVELSLAKQDLIQRGVLSSTSIGEDEIRVRCGDDGASVVIAFASYDGPVRR